MQTSSNFFNKNLFTPQDYNPHSKRTDRYHQSHIVQDPLRLKQQLTPWTQINPKYNFNTERLIKFKQKVNSQQMMEQLEQEMPEAKEIKSEMISNLFNFYKNNKEKKRSTLNNAKRRSSRGGVGEEISDGWTLPPIDDREGLEEGLVQNKQSAKKGEDKNEEKDNKKKPSSTYIQSISIRQYLLKLKQKQRVFSSPTSHPTDKSPPHNPTLKPQLQQFTSNRHAKAKAKPMFSSPISSVKQLGNEDISYRYAPIRNHNNPENSSYKKRGYLSPLQSLEQSFEMYKKAAEMEVQDSVGSRKLTDRYSVQKLTSVGIQENPYWKGNVQLSTLLSSPVLQSAKRSKNDTSISPVKKYSTISYSRSFSPTQNSVELPKINKQNSIHR